MAWYMEFCFFFKSMYPVHESEKTKSCDILKKIARGWCTLDGVTSRPDPLIISKCLQCKTFWSQTKALFMIRCMLSVESWFKTFRVQKWPYWVKIFEFLLHKITNFWHISACQWTMPSGLFAKKNHSIFFCSC